MGRRACDTSRLQTIRDDERRHIARELHDDLGQLLATLRVDLSLLQQQALPENASQQIHSMNELLLSAITSLRRIASNMRPRALDDGSLYFALQTLREDFEQRYSIECELNAAESELALDDRYSTAVFRIVQESLTNIARHAQAEHVWLSVRRHGQTLRIGIADDGIGISEPDLAKPHSLGLIGMRERVRALQGEMVLGDTDDRGGTRIDVVLPLPPEADRASAAAAD
ncbi:sensor histidine kinase [Pseudoduganella namucuonensis]|uniref:sensor histidine kinase n=1 Tax=Pseudoduganella namucuonensis TaxID=1035707 RepID=UPI001E58C459|nr:sensor histidine kinase [Pseudoduganella namucuonensis]